jgi:hypothetical protein
MFAKRGQIVAAVFEAPLTMGYKARDSPEGPL